MVTPSTLTFLSHVLTRVNQFSGGGLVLPRRKAITMISLTDCVVGRSAWMVSLSPACRLGTMAMGSDLSPRCTCTSIFGPVRSKRPPATTCAEAAGLRHAVAASARTMLRNVFFAAAAIAPSLDGCDDRVAACRAVAALSPGRARHLCNAKNPSWAYSRMDIA